MEERGFTEAPTSVPDEGYRDRFLKEYIDAVGAVGRDNNSLTWWASDMASKNRFTSALPSLLHKFFLAAEAAQAGDYDNLVILNPPWTIRGPLRKAIGAQGIDCVCLGSRGRASLSILGGWGRALATIFLKAVKSSYDMFYARRALTPVLKKRLSKDSSHYVIKTFLYDHSFTKDGGYRDAFFGALPDYLLKEQKRPLIFAYIAGDRRKGIENIGKCESHTVVPVEFFLRFGDILKAASVAIFGRIRVEKEVLFFGYDVREIIRNELLRTFKGVPFSHLLHYWAARRLFRTVPVDTFLLTYENNPWEKMCIVAARECSPKTKLAGYQHAAITQASANMFMSGIEKGVAPVPDRVLTVGRVPKDIMERYGSFDAIDPACGLRFEYLFGGKPCVRRRTGAILLALEGIFDVYKMVNYVIGELKGRGEYVVTVRTHPVLPVEKFRHKLTEEIEGTENFRISKGKTLKEDLEEADVVVYWGSTVSLEALCMGKPVVHFDTGSVLSYDPLFGCGHLKWTASGKGSLVNAIREIQSMPDEEFYRRQGKAVSYLREYFYPVTEEGLKKFIFN